MAEKNKKNGLEIVYRDIDSLKDAEYNPKKCSPKEEHGIKASIEKFGLVDPIIINTYEGRENVIVGGHQRKRIAKALGYDTIPCVEVCLPPDQEKELNIRLSKNTASIDEALLAIHFSKELLEEVGFKEEQLKAFVSDYEKEFNEVDNSSCVYPLVPKFSEKYDAVIIVSKNSIDTAYLETALGIKTAQSYKNTRTGKAMIIDIEQFRNQWENR